MRGLKALLPTIATIALLYLILDFFNAFAARPMSKVLELLLRHLRVAERFLPGPAEETTVALTVAGFVLALALFAALGLLVHGLFGRRLWRSFEDAIGNLPVLRAIFPHAKQVSEFLFDKKHPAFQVVVAVPYPHPGVYSLGFVTSDGMRSLSEKTKGEKVSVFIPSSPVPMTGWITFVPAEDVHVLPIAVDDALRFMVSAGLILPEGEAADLGKRSLLKAKG